MRQRVHLLHHQRRYVSPNSAQPLVLLTESSSPTASEKCQQEKRKTVNGEDILFAMTSLGFENYAEALKIYLSKYREVSPSTLPGRPTGGGFFFPPPPIPHLTFPASCAHTTEALLTWIRRLSRPEVRTKRGPVADTERPVASQGRAAAARGQGLLQLLPLEGIMRKAKASTAF